MKKNQSTQVFLYKSLKKLRRLLNQIEGINSYRLRRKIRLILNKVTRILNSRRLKYVIGSGLMITAFGFCQKTHAQSYPDVINLKELNGENGVIVKGNFDLLGRAVGQIGDFNKDGFDDIVLGAYSADGGGDDRGASYILFGSETGIDPNIDISALDGTNGFAVYGEGDYDLMGQAVNSAGDFNGDGYDDIILGVKYEDSYSNETGTAYVIFGTNEAMPAVFDLADLDGSNGFKINGEHVASFFGNAVSTIGDFNKDGFEDLIIGNYNSSQIKDYAGSAHIVFGTDEDLGAEFDISALDGTNGFTLLGSNRYEAFGRSVGSAGDINNDGFDDVIIGSNIKRPDGNYGGSAQIIFGRDTNYPHNMEGSKLDASFGFILMGPKNGDGVGSSVNGGFDFNGDDIDDVVVGALGDDTNGNLSGATFVFFGTETVLPFKIDLADINGENGIKINGVDSDDLLGSSVTSIGDFNKDGFDDILTGARKADPNGIKSGAAYIVFGFDDSTISEIELSDLDGSTCLGLFGDVVDENTGSSVSGAGDINGDGAFDFIIGAGSADFDPSTYPDEGAAYVIYGDSAFPNFPEVVSPIEDATVLEDEPFSLQIPSSTFDDRDEGDILSYSASIADNSILPSWLDFDESTFTFSGQPGNDEVGDYNIKVTATDLTDRDIFDTFILTVENVNDDPEFNIIENTTIDEDSEFKLTLTATDVDSPLENLVYSVDADSQNKGVTIVDDELQWTPLNEHVGINTIELIVADDAGGSDTQSVVLTVENVNDAPEIEVLSQFQINLGSLLEFQVLVVDVDNTEDEITYSLDESSLQKGMSINNGGFFSWQSANEVGSHLVDITVSDGLLKTTERILISVTNVTATDILDVENEIIIYPNPVSNSLSFKSDISISNLTVYLINAKGQKIMQKKLDNLNSTVDISETNKGLYILQILNANNQIIKRQIVIIK